jgi:hypothetical protein
MTFKRVSIFKHASSLAEGWFWDMDPEVLADVA